MTNPQNDKIFSTSKIIRRSRARKYLTAKEFWEENQNQLKVSYPHYWTVERGKKLPDINLAIRIAKILKIDLKLICHVWAKDQMPDNETKAFFEPRAGTEVKGVPTSVTFDLDNYYVFNDAQAAILKEKRHLWEILLFIMAFSTNPQSISQIARALDIEKNQVENCVEWLRNESLVVAEEGKLKTKRPYFHLPNTKAFKEIRDYNFHRVSENLLKLITPEQLQEKTAYRTSFMRRLSKKQAIHISQQIDQIIAQLGDMDVHGNQFYNLAVIFGPRAAIENTARES